MKYKELDEEQKIVVLEWAVESIDKGMKQQLQSRAYAAFVACINGKRESFDMGEIWAELPETTRNHFDHASGILLDLKAEIDELCEQIDDGETEPEDNPENTDPFSNNPDEKEGVNEYDNGPE